MDFERLRMLPYEQVERHTINGSGPERTDHEGNTVHWAVKAWINTRWVPKIKEWETNDPDVSKRLYQEMLRCSNLLYVELWRLTYVVGEIRPRSRRLCYTEIAKERWMRL